MLKQVKAGKYKVVSLDRPYECLGWRDECLGVRPGRSQRALLESCREACDGQIVPLFEYPFERAFAALSVNSTLQNCKL
jgi:hypothetical protein